MSWHGMGTEKNTTEAFQLYMKSATEVIPFQFRLSSVTLILEKREFPSLKNDVTKGKTTELFNLFGFDAITLTMQGFSIL